MKGGNNPNIAEDGKSTRFERGLERTKNAARSAAKKRSQNLNVQRLMTKMLTSQHKISDDMKKQFSEQLGFDVDDDEMLTNAAILALKIMQSGFNGDIGAAMNCFEIAGQRVDSRSQNEKERLKIERERLKIEKERLAILKEQAALSSGDSDDFPQIIIQTGEISRADSRE